MTDQEAMDLLTIVKSNWVEVSWNSSIAGAWHYALQGVSYEQAERIVKQCILRDEQKAPTPKYILGVVASERRRNGQMFISSNTSGRGGDPVEIKALISKARDSLKKPLE